MYHCLILQVRKLNICQISPWWCREELAFLTSIELWFAPSCGLILIHFSHLLEILNLWLGDRPSRLSFLFLIIFIVCIVVPIKYVVHTLRELLEWMLRTRDLFWRKLTVQVFSAGYQVEWCPCGSCRSFGIHYVSSLSPSLWSNWKQDLSNVLNAEDTCGFTIRLRAQCNLLAIFMCSFCDHFTFNSY